MQYILTEQEFNQGYELLESWKEHNIPISSLSLREAAMEKIKNMSDEELKLRILL